MPPADTMAIAATALESSGLKNSPLVEFHRIADDRTGHAMTAAAAATQFRTDDRDNFDPLLAQQRVGVGVTVVGKDDPRRCAHQISTAVPLRAFALIIAASCLDHAHL